MMGDYSWRILLSSKTLHWAVPNATYHQGNTVANCGVNKADEEFEPFDSSFVPAKKICSKCLDSWPVLKNTDLKTLKRFMILVEPNSRIFKRIQEEIKEREENGKK